MSVQARRERGDADLTGHDAEDTAGDAALGGDPDLCHPVARRVVHAARHHDREHLPVDPGGEHLLTGQRVDPAPGQGRSHDGEVFDGDGDRALFDIAADHLVGVVVEDVVGPEHVRNGDVAVGLTPFAVRHRFVDLQLTAGEAGESGAHDLRAFGQSCTRIAEEGVDGHGPGVDHGVERAARLLVQGELIELLTAGFDADLLEDSGQTFLLEGKTVDEGLRHRLDRELVVGIAGGVFDAVEGGDADRELLRIRCGEIRDVVRILAGPIWPESIERLIEEIRDGRSHGTSCCSSGRSAQRGLTQTAILTHSPAARCVSVTEPRNRLIRSWHVPGLAPNVRLL